MEQRYPIDLALVSCTARYGSQNVSFHLQQNQGGLLREYYMVAGICRKYLAR